MPNVDDIERIIESWVSAFEFSSVARTLQKHQNASISSGELQHRNQYEFSGPIQK